jgi:hypothetical protein
MGVSSIHSTATASASSVHSGTSSPGNSGQFATPQSVAATTSSEMSALQSLSMSYARKLDIAVRAGAEDDTVLLLCEPLLNPNIKVRRKGSESKRFETDLDFFFFFFFFSSSDFSLFSLSLSLSRRKDLDGFTLLHVAVSVNKKVLHPLLKHRLIDVNLRNRDGEFAEHCRQRQTGRLVVDRCGIPQATLRFTTLRSIARTRI